MSTRSSRYLSRVGSFTICSKPCDHATSCNALPSQEFLEEKVSQSMWCTLTSPTIIVKAQVSIRRSRSASSDRIDAASPGAGGRYQQQNKKEHCVPCTMCQARSLSIEDSMCTMLEEIPFKANTAIPPPARPSSRSRREINSYPVKLISPTEGSK